MSFGSIVKLFCSTGQCSGYISVHLQVTGHLLQGRLGLAAPDNASLMTAFWCVILNSVKDQGGSPAGPGLAPWRD